MSSGTPPVSVPQSSLHEDVPHDWKVVRLRDVVLSTSKQDPRKQPNTPFQYIDIASVSNESFRIVAPRTLLGSNAPGRARKVVQAGDSILSTVRPYLRNVAQVPHSLDGQICSTGFCVLRPATKSIDADFLFFSVMSPLFTGAIVGQQKGSSYPAVTDSIVLAESILLPPLPEQRAIAAVLNTVQDAIQATEQVIAAAQALKRSLMHYLFTYGPVPIDEADKVALKETEIGAMPEEWRAAHVGEVTRFSRKPRSLDLQAFGHIPFVPMELIPDHGTSITGFELREPSAIRSGTYFERGDILLAKITPSFENGKQCVADDIPLPFGYATTEVYALRPHSGDVDRYLLFHYLRLPAVRFDIAGRMEGTTGRQRVPKSVVEDYPLPLPPLPEQHCIAAMLEAVDAKIESERMRRSACNALFDRLLQDLMIGRVRVCGLEADGKVETE